MKKFAPVYAIIGIIIIGIVAFSLMNGTASAPMEEETATTTETGTNGAAPAAAGNPSTAGSMPGIIKSVVKVYANPAWGFKLRYDTSWNLTQTGKVVNVDSPTASFLISPEQEIAEPARLASTQTTRTILGQEVDVTRYDDPKEGYAYYEFFTLRVNKVEYYFKILSTEDPNERVEKFLKDIIAQ